MSVKQQAWLIIHNAPLLEASLPRVKVSRNRATAILTLVT